MKTQVPAVVIAQENGEIVAQNGPARRLMGEAAGAACWDHVGGLAEAEGLPCARGCVRGLIANGIERTQHARISVGGRRHHLTCTPLGGVAVCVLSPREQQEPETWQLMTSREREVLKLLADGYTTASMAGELSLSESTVRTHVENMRTKLGMPTRAALVALRFRLGFLE